MSLSTQEKVQIVGQYGQSKDDTGSPEVQVALLTADIKKLTEHFKTHTKDNHSRRGLLRKVSRRRSLLNYLRQIDLERYRKLIASLGLRS